MIKIITYPQSLEHAHTLLECSDCLLIGEDRFGLHLPSSFSRTEQAAILKTAQSCSKQVVIALNGMFHNKDIEALAEYLQFLAENQVSAIQIGDPGVLQVMRETGLMLPFIWDAGVLNTSAGNLNFWAERGAVAAVLAHELPAEELRLIMKKVKIPTIIQIYGAFALHHSARKLLTSYFSYLAMDQDKMEDLSTRDILQSDPSLKDKKSGKNPLFIKPLATPSTEGLAKQNYAIYEDLAGTHIFAHEDLNMLPYLEEIYRMGIYNWSLSSLFVEADQYTEIVGVFRQAADILASSEILSEELSRELNEKLRQLHPHNRKLGSAFYNINPQDIS